MANNDSRASKNTTSNKNLSGENFEPVFSMEQVSDLEDNYNETWGVSRRCAMFTLTKSKTELLDGCKSANDDEAFFSLIEKLTDYRKHLEAGIEIPDAAIARLLIVGDNL